MGRYDWMGEKTEYVESSEKNLTTDILDMQLLRFTTRNESTCKSLLRQYLVKIFEIKLLFCKKVVMETELVIRLNREKKRKHFVTVQRKVKYKKAKHTHTHTQCVRADEEEFGALGRKLGLHFLTPNLLWQLFPWE